MEEEKVIKSGVEFLNIVGIIFILLGIGGFMGILTTFDWDTYNRAKDLELTYGDELAVLEPQLITTWVMAGATLLINAAIGMFFVAIDRVALILKKIQLGIKED